jgi:hypothetical protein
VLRVDPNGKAPRSALRPATSFSRWARKRCRILKTSWRRSTTPGPKKDHVLALVRRNDRDMYIALPVTQRG